MEMLGPKIEEKEMGLKGREGAKKAQLYLYSKTALREKGRWWGREYIHIYL